MTTIHSFLDLAENLIGSSRLPTLLVGIDGIAGAGKSTFARNLVAAMEQCGQVPTLVRLDDYYYRPTGKRPIYFRDGDSESTENDYDYEWRRFRDQVLIPLRAGRPAILQKLDRERPGEILRVSAVAGAVVIVEGVTSLRRELAAHYGFRVFVRAPRDICIARVLERDGDAMRDWYKIYWRHEEDHYIKTHDPQAAADLVVDTAGNHEHDPHRAYARWEPAARAGPLSVLARDDHKPERGE